MIEATNEPIEMFLESGKITLGSQKLRFIESYEIKITSDLVGKAELTLKMLVNFSDKKQEQNPLLETE